MRNGYTNALLLVALTAALGASTYRPATIVSVQQERRSSNEVAMHNTVLDSALITTTELVYVFKVRCGNDVYSSEYVYPGKPQDAPRNWKTQVQVRIQGSRMFIQDAGSAELETKIVKHTKP